MIFYILVGLAALAIAVGYTQADMHVIIIILGVVVFAYTTRNKLIRMGDVYGTIVLCCLGVVCSGGVVIWILAEHYLAAVGAATTLTTLAYSAVHVMPAGIRIMRAVFGNLPYKNG